MPSYQDLSKSTSDRLDTIRRWIGIATLRCLKIGSVPEELQAEPLHCTSFPLHSFQTSEVFTAVLTIRVLYRLRSLSEQGPFDAATFSYAFPLLSQILLMGGIPGEEEDDPLEQVALALEVIKFHCGECTLSSLPFYVFFSLKAHSFQLRFPSVANH